jgi:conjugative transposon TraM protein
MNRNDETTPGKLLLTSGQKQQMKKYAVFALIFVIFALCMWLIFSPTEKEKDKSKGMQGFNTNIPMPKKEDIIGDKESAYEEDLMKKKQEEKMKSLQDFSTMFAEKSSDGLPDEFSLLNVKSKATPDKPQNSHSGKKSSIQTSAAAYQTINHTLGTFYENQTEAANKNHQVKGQREPEENLSNSEVRKQSVDEQMAIMERSYQIAAKYIPQLQGQMPEQAASQNRSMSSSGKETIIPVTQMTRQTVSALRQAPISSDTIKAFLGPQSPVFLDTGTETQKESKNSIHACIHDSQTVTDGQTVRLRLLDNIQVGTVTVPQNTVISGTVRIQGERLNITVSSLEFEGMILPVELTIYDTDGQRGIFIPNTQVASATKEIIANMGTSAGTNISLSSNAGQQLAADLGRNAIQGTSQYMAKKLREVKVNLKAGYRVLLLISNK